MILRFQQEGERVWARWFDHPVAFINRSLVGGLHYQPFLAWFPQDRDTPPDGQRFSDPEDAKAWVTATFAPIDGDAYLKHVDVAVMAK